jgi:FKBP-type peptidyl-prolyl cis-trans isomerase
LVLSLSLSLHYQFPNGEVFDANKACVFRLMSHKMIPGFDNAVASMKVKEQAWIYIPPPAAYGEIGYPPTIGRNQTLIFKVEVKK